MPECERHPGLNFESACPLCAYEDADCKRHPNHGFEMVCPLCALEGSAASAVNTRRETYDVCIAVARKWTKDWERASKLAGVEGDEQSERTCSARADACRHVLDELEAAR